MISWRWRYASVEGSSAATAAAAGRGWWWEGADLWSSWRLSRSRSRSRWSRRGGERERERSRRARRERARGRQGLLVLGEAGLRVPVVEVAGGAVDEPAPRLGERRGGRRVPRRGRGGPCRHLHRRIWPDLPVSGGLVRRRRRRRGGRRRGFRVFFCSPNFFQLTSHFIARGVSNLWAQIDREARERESPRWPIPIPTSTLSFW